jgi:hypothetical protein
MIGVRDGESAELSKSNQAIVTTTLGAGGHRILNNMIEDENGCWIWLRDLSYGYAKVSVNRITVRGHRLSCWLFHGRLPGPGEVVHHTCEVRRCVNPEHLEIVTCRENLMSSDTPAKRNAEKTHCCRDHEFNEVNTRYGEDGRRHCRLCNRVRRRA